MTNKKNPKAMDAMLSTEITHIHAHDDVFSHIKTPDGKEHYGMKGMLDAGQSVDPVYEECAEMASLRKNQERFNMSNLSRRGLMGAAALGVGAMLAISSEPRYAYAAPGSANNGNVIVAIFLRGGADGLSMVVPRTGTDYSRYQAMRPGLKLTNSVLLDMPGGKFGLHPAFTNMQKLMNSNQAAVVHSTGHVSESRSHFDKQLFTEKGVMAASMSSGWLGRYLLTTGNENTFRALTMGKQSAFMLATGTASLTPTMTDLGAFNINAPTADIRQQISQDLSSLYGNSGGAAQAAVNDTINSAMESLELANRPTAGVYPNNNILAKRLKGVAQIIKANKGLEVACVDDDGWDMHVKLNDGDPYKGNLYSGLKRVDDAIYAFWEDLGPELQKKVTIVTLSEFGRTGSTNGVNGADHGYGSTMFVISDQVRGGVVGKWPGLDKSALNEGDLNIVNDYRDTLAQIFTKKMGVAAGSTQMKQIFPDYTPKAFSLYK